MDADKPEINRRVISNEDSIYKGKRYKKIYDYPSCGMDEGSKTYVGMIREEDKRIYYMGETAQGNLSETELLYDFNLNIGDTIKNSWSFGVISRIDTVQLYGIWRRMFYFVLADYPELGFPDFWLEGIGGSNYCGIVDPLRDIPTSTYPSVRCVIHGNNLLYKKYPTDDCPCSSLSSQPVVEDVGRISFYVRDRQLCIHALDQAFTTLKIYTSEGKLVKSVTLSKQTDEITSSLEEFSPGSYLFIVSSSDSQHSGQFIVQ